MSATLLEIYTSQPIYARMAVMIGGSAAADVLNSENDKKSRNAWNNIKTVALAVLGAYALELMAQSYSSTAVKAAWMGATVVLSASAGLVGAGAYMAILGFEKILTFGTVQVLGGMALFMGGMILITFGQNIHGGIIDSMIWSHE